MRGAWRTVGEILAGAAADFRHAWRPLARTDVAYKLLAFALLTPATTLLLHWLRSGTTTQIVADTDILWFFVTTRMGVATLVLGGSLITAITALEAACLMAIGLVATRRAHLGARSALLFGARQAPNVLRLTANMVARLLVGLLPFGLALGLVYVALLRQHDINYYLAEHPPRFWVAAALVVVLVGALLALLVWTIVRWALALPLVLFEGVSPRRALGESGRRSRGHRSVITLALVSWLAGAWVLLIAVTELVDFTGRTLAPHFAGSLALLLSCLAGLLILWGALSLGVAIVNASLFSLVIVRLYLRVAEPSELRLPAAALEPGARGARYLTPRNAPVVAAIALLAASGVALLLFLVTRGNQPVLVIAHRGASAEAPENTLAAFRLAVEQGADFVELDVQESADGEVVVVHDSDLMKVGRSPAKIWATSAAELRAVDVGSHAGPQFAGERVPTLAEALAACKGGSRVIVELKSYGHDQRLEERVVSIVEAAGMEHDCIFMSLDHDMIKKMKELRPAWTSGILVAKAIGDITALEADFLAVEARMATRRFVRRAHRAGQRVYVWTVNDPAWMLAAMSSGVDGLITDRPELARRVVARRAQLSDAQRLLVALMVRLGARTEALAAEDALRP